MNADEIVRALRCSDVPDEPDGMGCSNKKCRYRDVDGACDIVSMCNDAADKITELNDFQNSQCAKLLARIAELEAQLAESQRRERAAVEDLNGTGACFTCKHFRRNGGDCFGAGRCRLDGIEIWPCNEPGVYRVEVPDDGRKTYEWRGPQEAGKGEAE